MIPDIRTLMLLYLMTNVINAGAIAVIWSQNRRRYAGILFWLAAMTLQVVGPILHVLRGIIPDLISMTLSNTIMLAGVLITFIGLERFTGKKGRQIPNYVLLAVFIAVSAYFAVIQPNLTARDIAVSAMVMIYTFQCCWLLLRRADPGMRIITRIAGIVFAVYAAFNFARIILLIISPDQINDFFKSGAVNALAITGYILLNVGVTISLVLMVNRRLLADVRAQEEKFTTAFHSSPHAIILTRMSDGMIREVNDGFVNITGHQYAEVIGKTTLDLHLWVREEDRLAIVDTVRHGREVHAVEYQFRKKTGEVLTGLLSASQVTINNEKFILASIGDITERKQAEEALRGNRQRFQDLVESLYDWVWEVDSRGQYTYVSPQVKNILGYEPRELLGKTPFDLMPAEEAQRVLEVFEALLAERKPIVAFENNNLHKDGHLVVLETSGLPCYDPDGTFKGYRGIDRDITERGQAEETLRKSEARFRSYFEMPLHGIAITSPDKGWIQVNDQLCSIVGYAREELVRMTWAEMTHPDDLAADLEQFNRLLSGQIEQYKMDKRFIRKDGTVVWTTISVGCVRKSDGGVDYIVGVMDNITERKRAEETLRDQEERYRQIVTTAQEGIWVLDAEAKTSFVNQRMAEMLGYSVEEMLGRSLFDFMDEAARDEAERLFEQRIQGVIEQHDFRFRGKGGSDLWTIISTNPLFDDNGQFTGALGMIADITERKRAEQEKEKLEALNRQLQKSESLGRMAGAIAHHFNNQLQAVTGNLEMALGELPRAAGGAVEFLTEAKQATRRASEVSSLMLTYLGQTITDRAPLDLSMACRRNLPMLQAAMPKNVVLESDLPSPGPVISANVNQIQQVLTNLVANAWEAGDKAQCVIHLSVKTALPSDISELHRFPIDAQMRNNAYACLEVADTGCGIAAKDIDNLFDPFFSSKFTGRGLGLAVVLGIVRAHAGAITVESEPGSGSIFRVYFPLTAEEIPRPPEKVAQAPEIQWGGTVLLVEGEEMLRRVAAAMLTRLGFTVLAAKNGVEAVEVFRQHSDEIRCVLCDLTMPRMNGWETLTALRQIAPGIPVILAGGYGEEQVMDGDHPERPQACLSKPYLRKQLREALRQALASENDL